MATVTVRRTRYRADVSLQRFPTAVFGGSPLRLFRVTPAGADVVTRIVAGEPVAESRLVDALRDAGAIHPIVADGPFDRADVTIVMPVYGRPPDARAGTIVVDDGSPDPIPGATIRLDINRGPGAARNAGLAAVTTPLVAFVDADVTTPDGWIESLLPHFADGRVALVAPRVASAADGTTTIARYERDHSPLDLGRAPGRVRAGTRISYVPAAAIVCRVEAMRAIGGFDEQLRYGEDVDLAWRLDAAGWWCRYEPSVTVFHAPRPTWAAWIAQRVAYGSSAAPLAARHRGALTPLSVNAWSAAAWALTAIGHPLAGVALGAGAAAAFPARVPDLPAGVAFRLAVASTWRAGDQITNAVRRVWWPLLAIAALRSRSARRALVASALAARHPLRLADDAAYSVGVWHGMFTARHLGPALPVLSASERGRRVSEQTERYGRAL